MSEDIIKCLAKELCKVFKKDKEKYHPRPSEIEDWSASISARISCIYKVKVVSGSKTYEFSIGFKPFNTENYCVVIEDFPDALLEDKTDTTLKKIYSAIFSAFSREYFVFQDRFDNIIISCKNGREDNKVKDILKKMIFKNSYTCYFKNSFDIVDQSDSNVQQKVRDIITKIVDSNLWDQNVEKFLADIDMKKFNAKNRAEILESLLTWSNYEKVRCTVGKWIFQSYILGQKLLFVSKKDFKELTRDIQNAGIQNVDPLWDCLKEYWRTGGNELAEETHWVMAGNWIFFVPKPGDGEEWKQVGETLCEKIEINKLPEGIRMIIDLMVPRGILSQDIYDEIDKSLQRINMNDDIKVLAWEYMLKALRKEEESKILGKWFYRLFCERFKDKILIKKEDLLREFKNELNNLSVKLPRLKIQTEIQTEKSFNSLWASLNRYWRVKDGADDKSKWVVAGDWIFFVPPPQDDMKKKWTELAKKLAKLRNETLPPPILMKLDLKQLNEAANELEQEDALGLYMWITNTERKYPAVWNTILINKLLYEDLPETLRTSQELPAADVTKIINNMINPIKNAWSDIKNNLYGKLLRQHVLPVSFIVFIVALCISLVIVSLNPSNLNLLDWVFIATIPTWLLFGIGVGFCVKDSEDSNKSASHGKWKFFVSSIKAEPVLAIQGAILIVILSGLTKVIEACVEFLQGTTTFSLQDTLLFLSILISVSLIGDDLFLGIPLKRAPVLDYNEWSEKLLEKFMLIFQKGEKKDHMAVLIAFFSIYCSAIGLLCGFSNFSGRSPMEVIGLGILISVVIMLYKRFWRRKRKKDTLVESVKNDIQYIYSLPAKKNQSDKPTSISINTPIEEDNIIVPKPSSDTIYVICLEKQLRSEKHQVTIQLQSRSLPNQCPAQQKQLESNIIKKPEDVLNSISWELKIDEVITENSCVGTLFLTNQSSETVEISLDNISCFYGKIELLDSNNIELHPNTKGSVKFTLEAQKPGTLLLRFAGEIHYKDQKISTKKDFEIPVRDQTKVQAVQIPVQQVPSPQQPPLESKSPAPPVAQTPGESIVDATQLLNNGSIEDWLRTIEDCISNNKKIDFKEDPYTTSEEGCKDGYRNLLFALFKLDTGRYTEREITEIFNKDRLAQMFARLVYTLIKNNKLEISVSTSELKYFTNGLEFMTLKEKGKPIPREFIISARGVRLGKIKKEVEKREDGTAKKVIFIWERDTTGQS